MAVESRALCILIYPQGPSFRGAGARTSACGERQGPHRGLRGDPNAAGGCHYRASGENGGLIVKLFYRGRLDAWREHGPKDSLLRKLAIKFGDDELGMSATGIYR